MTDPLLTIEDATREYRVSPKTIRRRLAAGEIEGAYKRPGQRGPEWVISRGALEAAGFARRADVAVADLPATDGARAEYWERRALDAEAALQATATPAPANRPQTPGAEAQPAEPARGRRRRSLALAVVLGGLVLAVLAGAAIFADDGPARDEGADRPAPVATAESVLATLTERGDPIGLIGPGERAIPAGRRAVPAVDLVDEGGRYVLASFDGDRDPEEVIALRRSAALVLDLADEGGRMVVFDTGGTPGAAAGDAADPPPGAAAEPSTEAGEGAPPEVEAPSETEAPAPPPGPGIEAGPAPVTPQVAAPPTAAAPAPVGGTVVVEAGDSFWSIAADLVATDGGGATAAEITPMWTSLVHANVDRLVEPGNPDLLHVGQVLVVPGG